MSASSPGNVAPSRSRYLTYRIAHLTSASMALRRRQGVAAPRWMATAICQRRSIAPGLCGVPMSAVMRVLSRNDVALAFFCLDHRVF